MKYIFVALALVAILVPALSSAMEVIPNQVYTITPEQKAQMDAAQKAREIMELKLQQAFLEMALRFHVKVGPYAKDYYMCGSEERFGYMCGIFGDPVTRDQ